MTGRTRSDLRDSAFTQTVTVTRDVETLRLATDRWEAPEHVVGEVVLMHGGGQTRHAWRDTGHVLADRGWRVSSYDARGHGASDWSPAGRYSLSDRGSDLVSVARACASPPVLVGASMGGMTAIAACGAYPDRFRGMVLVDVALRVDTSESQRIHAFMAAHAEGFATLEEVADAVQEYNPARRRSASPEGLKRNVVQREDERWYWRWDPRILNADRSELDRMASHLRDAARRVTVPVLLVRGTRSQMVDAEALAEFLEIFPGAQVADIEGASHMVAGDDNNAFADAVVRFLDQLAEA